MNYLSDIHYFHRDANTLRVWYIRYLNVDALRLN